MRFPGPSSTRRAPRSVVVCLVVLGLLVAGACSSSSPSKDHSQAAAKNRPTAFVQWKNCLTRHGVKLPAPQKSKAKPGPALTRARITALLQHNPAARMRFAAALLKAPRGVDVALYKRAINTCFAAKKAATSS